MTVFQGDLIVCGGYINTAGGVPVQGIARWDGQNWHAMGTGANAFPGEPASLTVHNEKLIAGGDGGFGASAPVVAEWTGQHWAPLEGLGQPAYNTTVNAFANYQGDLIAAGDFIRPGGAGRDIARWDGTQWHSMGDGPSLGQGVGGSLWAVAVGGGNLIAAGQFIDMDDLPANCIAQWNGVEWSAMAGGLRGGNQLVRQLTRIGDSVYAVGGFTIADERVSAHLARWQIGGTCPADIAPESADGEVGIDDVLAVISAWGACPAAPEDCPGNIIATGASAAAVDVEDVLAVISAWGPCE
jgi:hypothetical protein